MVWGDESFRLMLCFFILRFVICLSFFSFSFCVSCMNAAGFPSFYITLCYVIFGCYFWLGPKVTKRPGLRL